MGLSNLPVGDATAALASLLESPRQIVATLAAAVGIGLVVGGAFVRTMMPLRWFAVGSNAGLLVFGLLHPSMVTLLISALLLPINLYRAVEITRLTRRVHLAGAAAEQASLWLRPYMKTRRIKAGQTLFTKGDLADHLYLLVDGELELVEIGRALEPGLVFGEIALFSPSHLRTNTVRCVRAGTVLQIHESTVRELYFQEPSFGFHLIELLAERLSRDVERASGGAVATGGR